jgi:hypothetical protein
MFDISTAPWQKATDVNREYATFELLKDGDVLFDVGFSDDKKFEIAFGPAIFGLVVEWELFQELVEVGRKFAEEDEELTRWGPSGPTND